MSIFKMLKSQKTSVKIFVIILVIISITLIFLSLNYNSKSPALTTLNIDSSTTTNTSELKYIIKGKIEYQNNTQLLINSDKVKIYDDGSFNYSIDLKEGKNYIEITLIKNGKETKKQFIINRIAKIITEQKSPSPNIVIDTDPQHIPTDTPDQISEPAVSAPITNKIPIADKPTQANINNETKIVLSSDKNIIDFKCSIKCTVDIEENTISVILLESSDPLYFFTPTITASSGATIDQIYSVGRVFSPSENPHKIVVVAADNSTKEYAINITVDNSGEYELIDPGSMSGYPWDESNCQMSGYWSMGGADGNGGDGRGYGCRQSASYVAWKIATIIGKYYSWGNAVNFTSSAVAAGYTEGAPQAGSIAVMDPATSGASEGHVAWVEAVSGNTVTVSQYGYNYGAGYGMYSMMNLSVSAFDHYVHIE